MFTAEYLESEKRLLIEKVERMSARGGTFEIKEIKLLADIIKESTSWKVKFFILIGKDKVYI